MYNLTDDERIRLFQLAQIIPEGLEITGDKDWKVKRGVMEISYTPLKTVDFITIKGTVSI